MSTEFPVQAAEPRLLPAGSRGLLMDVAQGVFDAQLQLRLLGFAAELRRHPDIEQVVPGMNNLLLVLRSMEVNRAALDVCLRQHWAAMSQAAPSGRIVEIPVTYGGSGGEDLPMLADHAGLGVFAFVELHSATTYQVACLGAMPGFPYLSGLNPQLAAPRRAVPRMRLEQGAVIIGGSQAGVMPCAAPSGWHVIGHTQCQLFDPASAQPTLLLPGDHVRFKVVELLS